MIRNANNMGKANLVLQY